VRSRRAFERFLAESHVDPMQPALTLDEQQAALGQTLNATGEIGLVCEILPVDLEDAVAGQEAGVRGG